MLELDCRDRLTLDVGLVPSVTAGCRFGYNLEQLKATIRAWKRNGSVLYIH
jgi:hypothetical protein